jgi:hypothetical protein
MVVVSRERAKTRWNYVFFPVFFRSAVPEVGEWVSSRDWSPKQREVLARYFMWPCCHSRRNWQLTKRFACTGRGQKRGRGCV